MTVYNFALSGVRSSFKYTFLYFGPSLSSAPNVLRVFLLFKTSDFILRDANWHNIGRLVLTWSLNFFGPFLWHTDMSSAFTSVPQSLNRLSRLSVSCSLVSLEGSGKRVTLTVQRLLYCSNLSISYLCSRAWLCTTCPTFSSVALAAWSTIAWTTELIALVIATVSLGRSLVRTWLAIYFLCHLVISG